VSVQAFALVGAVRSAVKRVAGVCETTRMWDGSEANVPVKNMRRTVQTQLFHLHSYLN
jgi:hypothetical protein